MKHHLFSIFLTLIGSAVVAQSVAINTDGSVAHASAILDVKSTSKGLLAPRMTTAQRNAVASPAAGLLLYDTDFKTYYYYTGTAWKAVNVALALADNDGDTKIQVEELVDDNKIRFDISGDERMILTENSSGAPRLEFINAEWNTFLGQSSGLSNTSGIKNSALGYNSLRENTTGYRNAAVGFNTLYNNTTGFQNTAIGSECMADNTTGGNNAALGYGALLDNVSGSYNVAIGVTALLYNTSGFYNAGVGLNTLFRTTASTYNTALGALAGRDFNHGNNNTFIGANTQANADGYSNSTALGYGSLITASNQVRIGNATTTSIGGFQNWTNISDARVKNDVKHDVPGLDFIARLRPVTYMLDRHKIQEMLGQERSEMPVSGRCSGFLAQEVEKTAREIGFEFSGVDAPKNEKDFYGLRYAEFTVPLVKAVQELDAENKQLKAAILALQKRLDALEASTK